LGKSTLVEKALCLEWRFAVPSACGSELKGGKLKVNVDCMRLMGGTRWAQVAGVLPQGWVLLYITFGDRI
jgi:hypothetical protein